MIDNGTDYDSLKNNLKIRFKNALKGFEIEVERKNLDFYISCSCGDFTRSVYATFSDAQDSGYIQDNADVLKVSYIKYAVDEIRNGRKQLSDFPDEYHTEVVTTLFDLMRDNALESFLPIREAMDEATLALQVWASNVAKIMMEITGPLNHVDWAEIGRRIESQTNPDR